MNKIERIELLEKSIRNGKKIAIYVAEEVGGALFRYQCENVLEATLESERWQAIWFLKSELGEIEKYLDKISLVVILRQTAKNRFLLDFIEKIQDKNKKVLFMLDDLIFNYADLRFLMKTTGQKNIGYYAGYCWGVRRIAKRVDGFITTNDFLKKRIERAFGKPCEVIRNSLNEEQIEISERCLNDKKEIGKVERFEKIEGFEEKENDFVIGYFSGSPTHEKDLEVAVPGILKFLRKHEEAKFEVVGYMKFHGEMRKYFEDGRIRSLSFVDFRKLQELMSEVDVNIAPLVVNDFTNCKSELKFFEAGVVETTTIASPTYAFKHAIEDSKNGFLAKPGEWYEKLEYLYQHPEENRKIAKKAREDALEHYYGKEFLREVEKVYDSFLEK